MQLLMLTYAGLFVCFLPQLQMSFFSYLCCFGFVVFMSSAHIVWHIAAQNSALWRQSRNFNQQVNPEPKPDASFCAQLTMNDHFAEVPVEQLETEISEYSACQLQTGVCQELQAVPHAVLELSVASNEVTKCLVSCNSFVFLSSWILSGHVTPEYVK